MKEDAMGEAKIHWHKQKGVTIPAKALVVLIPAVFSAWQSYSKMKTEADAGYQTLAVEVQKQAKALERVQLDNEHWRRLLETMLKETANVAPVRRRPIPGDVPVVPIIQADELRKLADRPPVSYKPSNLPKTLDTAVEQMQQTKK